MKHILGIFIFALTLATAAGASDIFFESEDAFAASQTARNKGVEAFRAGDMETALVHMEEALKHRPNNPLLLGYVAYLAAETGNTTRAADAARQYAGMNIVPAAGIQASIQKALGDDAAPIMAAFAENQKPAGETETKFMLPETVHLVEGIAMDGDGTFFFGSVVSGGIYRMDATGPTKIVDAKEHEFGSIFGMTVHGGSLYATFAHIEQTPGYTKGEGQTGVAKINPASGEVEQVWTLPGGADGQQIADITVTTDGAILVTDAAGKKVYQITGDTLFPLFAHDGFLSPQGIAEVGPHLIMADYGRGLWRLDRTTGKATLLGAPAGVSLHGIDGLVRHGDRLIALQNGVTPHSVLDITLSEDGSFVESVAVLARGFNDYGEPTLGISTPDGLYFIAGSQWPSYGTGGVLNEGAEAEPTPVVKLVD